MQALKESSTKVLKQPQKICQHSKAAQQIRLCVRFLLQLNPSMICSEKNIVTQKRLLESRLQGKPKEKVSEQVISFLKWSQSHCFHCIHQSTGIFCLLYNITLSFPTISSLYPARQHRAVMHPLPS